MAWGTMWMCHCLVPSWDDLYPADGSVVVHEPNSATPVLHPCELTTLAGGRAAEALRAVATTADDDLAACDLPSLGDRHRLDDAGG